MVTYAQAQERGERWANADVPGYQHREVRVREFDLGFVVWAEGRPGGPVSDGGRARLVIARDSGEATLWPGLPVDEVIRRYEAEYGTAGTPAPAPAPERLDLEATSFLLTPPEWLQEAADQIGIPDRRSSGEPRPSAPAPAAGSTDTPAPGGPGTPPPGTPAAGSPVPAAGSTGGTGGAAWPAGGDAGGSPWDAADTSSSGDGEAQAPPATVFAPPLAGSDADDTPPPPSSEARTALLPEGSALPRTAVAPAVQQPDEGPGSAYGYPQPPGAPGTGQNTGQDQGRGPATPPPPAAPPAAPGAPGTPGAPQDGGTGGSGGGVHHAATMLADPSQGGAPGGPGTPPPPPSAPGTPGAGGLADADTGKSSRGGTPPRGSRGGNFSVPPPPGEPGTPGAGSGGSQGGPGAPGGSGGGYVPTQLVSADDVASQGRGVPGQGGPGEAPGSPADSGGGSAGVHHAATMLAGPGAPGPAAPQPPGAPPAAPGGPPPGAPQAAPPGAPPQPPTGPGMPGPGMPGPGGAPGAPGAPAYGYPQPPTGQPTVGPGYLAVLRYRAPDGSEQQLIRRSAPGTPHPEWQILHELRGLNVPPEQVLELHTELESCDLPGGYCARMIRETWPQVRISHTAAYGRDHASRQQGMRHLVEHQGELHQVADAPPRPAPHRVPLPPPHQIQPAPPIPPDGIGHELMQAFGPQGVFRFDQHAVSRQGVPDIVGQVLVWAGVPFDVTPFFWGQAQPGRPVPTLAELAQERGVQPAPDAGSYLVVGNDFGRRICVQYGTAHIVAVPLEAGPGGQPQPPQFVSTGLPEFVRCLALLGRMWPLRYGLTPDQAGRWTVDFQTQLAMLDPAALSSPENWWSVLLEQMWDGLF